MPLFVTTRVLPRLLPLLLLALPLRGQSLLPTPLPNTPQGAKPIAPAPAPAAPASEPAVPLPPPNPPPPVTQEKGRPIWGVYVGNDINGTLLHAYEKWLGRRTDAILGYTGAANWQDYNGSVPWEVDIWTKAGRRVLWSVPLIPNGATLEEAARGAYNDHWRQVAVRLAAWHPNEPVIYLRTGWEFNGDWFPYSSRKDPQAFIGAWRQFVSTFRSVSGRFRFDWCPSAGAGHVEEAYPGDDYVDIIGLDIYDEVKWCKIKDPAERWEKVTLHGDHTLLWHQAFARAHHKPMSYPEWGAGGNDAGDNPLFIERMHQWFLDNHVIYASYWDSDDAYQGRLSGGRYPLAAAKYRELFGAPREGEPAREVGAWLRSQERGGKRMRSG